MTRTRAEGLLDGHTCIGGEPGTGWDLHEIRHSALTHLGESGVSLLLFMAKSRHKKEQHARRYFKPSAATWPRSPPSSGPEPDHELRPPAPPQKPPTRIDEKSRAKPTTPGPLSVLPDVRRAHLDVVPGGHVGA